MTRIVLITGGNRGLGRASALAVADAGDDVVITYRSHADEAADVVEAVRAKGRTALALQLDTTAFETFAAFDATLGDRLQAAFGRDTVDALVNNAGAAASTPLGSTAVADLDLLVDVHFKGVYLLTQQLLTRIADGGRILLLSSGLSRFSQPGLSVYGAMKGAIDTLTRYWALELGPRGITVNAVAPGPIATDFGGGRMRDDDGARAAMSARAALGRIGEAEDIGAIVATLLGGGTGWVTGQRIEASGGTNL